METRNLLQWRLQHMKRWDRWRARLYRDNKPQLLTTSSYPRKEFLIKLLEKTGIPLRPEG